MVGQGMADNPMNALIIPSKEPLEISPPQTVGITQFGSYVEALSGIIESRRLVEVCTGNENSDTEQFCKDTVMSIWHYHGGCHVNKVVDHDYKVLRVDALRVIDGSTFSFDSPGTNPQATVMMLGRYIGQRILQER
ncbi:hypothetical protein POM88_028870 [Heracleum sosnowskyi]|uniref:Glucose-methanol-choline oxidoreductase C-terminal domain-containing protein n=1 Tax=Heracleum sosnowskyi TaxID=360622 RepID=A0AAD8MH53_9APIA|nr:hypothetical protein POM88_028870 [Heracleum sosnowskyi]